MHFATKGRRYHATGIRCALLLVAAALGALATNASADQATPVQAAWFGLPLPPGLQPHAAPAIIGDRGPVPAMVPPGEERHRELEGARVRMDLERIVAFSVRSRERREVGDGQLWGRISGFPSGTETMAWAAERFRQAGISDVRFQTFDQSADASFWMPLRWEVRLLGDSRFGAGSEDVTFETAMPLSPSEIAGGSMTAPLVFVGTASPAELVHIDVSGKVAVQHVTPQAHTVFERSPTVQRAQDLASRGAVAVLNVVAQPGNGRARDFSNCGGPCFNLGGRDGAFLERVMDSAAQAGTLPELRVRIDMETERRSGLSASNAVAIIRGSSRSDEVIVLNAHGDGWFDAAGDNADGLSVLIALAHHFAKPENRSARTLVFVASAGHHSTGLNGPRAFVAMNPELAQNAVLVLNIEHVAQRNLSRARSVFEDGYREYVADAVEAPIVAGITNAAPFLEDLFRQGVSRYGTNFVSGPSSMASGEGGGYRSLGVPIVTTMQAPPLYHTSGEVLETISTPGLERMARFLAFFIKEVDRAALDQIDPPRANVG
jgi:hypothetical protein